MGCCCGNARKIIKKGEEKNSINNYRANLLIQRNLGTPKNNVDRKRKLAILKKQGKIK